MAESYVTPDESLRQNFEPPQSPAYTSAQLIELERQSNPHNVEQKCFTFSKQFTLVEAMKEGLNLTFKGTALKIFGRSEQPDIAAALAGINKRTDMHTEVPESLLVLQAGINGWQTNLPFESEWSFNGIKPTHATNNPSAAYNGSHLVIAAKASKPFKAKPRVEFHTAPQNLKLLDAINAHDLDTEDLDTPVVGSVLHAGEKIRIIRLDENNNSYDKVFNSERGRAYLAKAMGGITPMPLNPNDPTSPKIVSVRQSVYEKAQRAVIRSKLNTSKHAQIVSTGNISSTVVPLVSGDEPVDFSNITNHPYFKGREKADIERKLNKPRYISVTCTIRYIPKYRKN